MKKFEFFIGAYEKSTEFLRQSPDKKSEIFSDNISDSVKEQQIKGFYEFAAFRLDVKKRRLTKLDDGEIVPLTPKEFDVLFLLVTNQSRTIEKDELLEAIWKDTFVEEGTLTRNVSWLRKKLAAHDDGNETKFIETVPKRGYRFLPEVVKTVEDLPAVSSGNSIVVEEEIIQQIQIEETLEISPTQFDSNHDGKFYESNARLFPDSNVKALPAAPARFSVSPVWILPALLIFAALAFFAFRNLTGAQNPKITLAARVVPFSGLPGREDCPSFSPDGKQMVFSWNGGNDANKLNVYVKLIGAGEPVRLTTGETDDINPVFSPDGKSIAFVRVFPTHNEIVLIPALGGAERKILERASYASLSFSPDGKLLAHAELGAANNKAGIFTINLENGDKTQITAPEAQIVDHTPRFSPDGKTLAFVRYFSSFKREIFVVAATGGDARQITSDDKRIYGLAWNADSRALFFTSFRAVDGLNLWRVSLNEKAEPEMISTGGKNLNDIAASPDGRTVAFVEETEDENIWEINTECGVRSAECGIENQADIPHSAFRIPQSKLIASTRADHSPQFSPDGARIVFASERTGNYEIWLSDADGKNQRQITDAKGSAGSPRFSPDGKFIAYDAQIAGGSDIYIISTEGGAARRLTENAGNNFLPAWSADSEWIFFNSNRAGDEQIWKMPARGGDASQITRQGAFEMFAAPDGKRIVYSKGGGKIGLWSVSIDGADEKPIAELADAGAWRSWTAARAGIYYTAFAAQTPLRIKFYDFATGKTRDAATVDNLPLTYYANLAASPDGKKLLYARQDQTAATIMLAELSE